MSCLTFKSLYSAIDDLAVVTALSAISPVAIVASCIFALVTALAAKESVSTVPSGSQTTANPATVFADPLIVIAIS